MNYGTVIVGAGHAGHAAAMQLRMCGYGEPVILIGDEAGVPYQRPPLSKRYLLRETTRERLALAAPDAYAKKDIYLLSGESVTAIDTGQRELVLSGGDTLRYDKLVLATGTRARKLPESVTGGLDGVHFLRTVADADRLAAALEEARSVLVIGAGFIGLEFAAVARKLGKQVSVIVRGRLMERSVGAEVSAYFRELHLSNGVELLEDRELERLTGEQGRVTGALLSDGSRVEADLVLAGVGAEPVAELAEAAGIAVDDGILVDEAGLTSAADVYAIGDCANFPWNGGRLRLESVQNADYMAKAVAAHIAGRAVPARPAPWFWSDQYDAKLQIAGLAANSDRTVRRAGSGENSCSFWRFRNGNLVAVEAINDAAAFVTGRKLLDSGLSPTVEQIADASLPLKDLAAQLIEEANHDRDLRSAAGGL